MTPFPLVVPEFAKIKTWPCCDLNGMVFIWYHCDRIEPTWNIPEQEEITNKEWIYRGRTEHYVNSHIQVRGGDGNGGGARSMENVAVPFPECCVTLQTFTFFIWELKKGPKTRSPSPLHLLYCFQLSGILV